MKRLSFFLGFFLFCFYFTPLALAQGENPELPTDDEVNAIARKMYCPVCENTPLDVCPIQACSEWRELIRIKLSEGWTEREIMDYFVEQYGYRVLAEPPATGLNWLVYLVPPLVFLIGIFIYIRALRSMKSASAIQIQDDPTSANKADQADDDYYQRIESQLRNP
jgi:cytochrome c-type biogenesis protein CcmH